LPAKMRWIKEHEPDLFCRAARFVAIKDWVIHQLTGQWSTDICMASGTGLVDLRTHQWHEESLKLAGVDAARLPSLALPQQIVGRLHARGAALLNLPADLPVMPGGGDGGLANIGA